MTTKDPKQVWLQPIHFMAFGFGSGLSPVMPGTCGTVVGVLIYSLIQNLNTYLYAFILLLSLLAGIWICDKSAKDLGVHDHPSIVWDEIAGYLLTMFLVPKGWLWVLLGFVYFRLFDIWKPWPIKTIDKRVEGGLGIMLDDVVAGVFAWVLLQLSIWFLVPLITH